MIATEWITFNMIDFNVTSISFSWIAATVGQAVQLCANKDFDLGYRFDVGQETGCQRRPGGRVGQQDSVGTVFQDAGAGVEQVG